MTNGTAHAPKTPLGIGALIASSFSILFGNFTPVFIIGFAGALIGFVVSAFAIGADVTAGTGIPDNLNTFWIGLILSVLINIFIYGLVTALLIQLAYDVKLGRRSSLGAYFSNAMPAIVPIAVLGIIVGLLSAIGALALLIGALWVYAVYYVMAPVAVIERGGFGSMGRSAELTRDYRWPIVGLIIVAVVLSVMLDFAATFILGVIAAGSGPLVLGLVTAFADGLVYAFGGILAALIYARLREIKEGVNVDQIASVFD